MCAYREEWLGHAVARGSVTEKCAAALAAATTGAGGDYEGVIARAREAVAELAGSE